MSDKKADYYEELKQNEAKDITHSWVSSSGFLFYLQIGLFLAFMVGCSAKLCTKRFHKAEVNVQESTLYTPKYK